MHLQSSPALQITESTQIKPFSIPENETIPRENSPIMTGVKPNQKKTKQTYIPFW
jgi:hypothetical protein